MTPTRDWVRVKAPLSFSASSRMSAMAPSAGASASLANRITPCLARPALLAVAVVSGRSGLAGAAGAREMVGRPPSALLDAGAGAEEGGAALATRGGGA